MLNGVRRRDDFWDALFKVAAAGGLALFFVGIGYYLARRQEQGLGLFPAGAPKLPNGGRARMTGGIGGNSYTVGATPVKIVDSTVSGIERTVIISTDQAIRVGPQAENGMIIPGGVHPFTYPFPLRPDDELWAVRATNATATVAVTQRSSWDAK